MKNFICKKCGNTTYIIQEKLNGTGKTLRLYCAKCGTRHKWLNRQEKVSYSTHSAEIDKDKEIARLTAENQRLKEEAAEQKSIAEHEHATQMEWFSIAGDYKAENAELKKRLENAVELPFIHKFHIEDTKGNAVTLYQLVYIDDDNSITTEIDNSEERTEARLAVLKGGRE